MNNFSKSDSIKPRLSDLEQKYLYNLGVKNFKTKNYNRALAIFQMLFIWNGQDSMCCKALAGCYQSTNNYFMAALTYSHCLNIDSSQTNVDCYFYLGVCLFELKNYKAAQKSFLDFKNKVDKALPNLYKKTELYLRAIDKFTKENSDIEDK